MKVNRFPFSRQATGRAFTLIELLVVVVIVGILAALAFALLGRVQQMAKRTQCINNLRQFAAADIAYFNDNGEFPPMQGIVPSSISVDRLAGMAKYLNVSIPAGPAKSWPKRMQQPVWINCPMAKDSGYAEGLTVGGGLYTGYIYVGGVEDSQMVVSGMASLPHPEHSAQKRNLHRGVLWADILSEFRTGDPRRFECFHVTSGKKYPDFRFPQNEIDGIHRAWSDGSVEWVPIHRLDLSGGSSPDQQIIHFLGNYYY